MELRRENISEKWKEISASEFEALLKHFDWFRDAYCGGEWFWAKLNGEERLFGARLTGDIYFVDPEFHKPKQTP